MRKSRSSKRLKQTAIETLESRLLLTGTIPVTLSLQTTTPTVQAGAQALISAYVSYPSNDSIPGGDVAFYANGVQIDPSIADVVSYVGPGQALAVCASTDLPVGSDQITGQYSGDYEFAPATSSNSVQVKVTNGTPLTPNIALRLSPNPANSGAAVALTATVTGSGATPTGSVTFYDNGVALGAASSLSSSGVATMMTASLPVGKDSIYASYGGDSNYSSGQSSSQTETINADSSTDSIEITTPPDEVVGPGQALDLEAQVSDGEQSDRGTLSPDDGGSNQNSLKGVPVQFHMTETDSSGDTIASQVFKAVTNAGGKAMTKVRAKVGGIADFVADIPLKDGGQIASMAVQDYFGSHLPDPKMNVIPTFQIDTPTLSWTTVRGVSYELKVLDDTPGADPTMILDQSNLMGSYTFSAPLKPGHDYLAAVQGSEVLTIPNARSTTLMSAWSEPLKFKVYEQKATNFAVRVDSSVTTGSKTLITLTVRTTNDDAGRDVNGPPRLLKIVLDGNWGQDITTPSAFASYQTLPTYIEGADITAATVVVGASVAQGAGLFSTSASFTIETFAYEPTPATFTLTLLTGAALHGGTYTGKTYVESASDLDKTIWPNG